MVQMNNQSVPTALAALVTHTKVEASSMRLAMARRKAWITMPKAPATTMAALNEVMKTITGLPLPLGAGRSEASVSMVALEFSGMARKAILITGGTKGYKAKGGKCAYSGEDQLEQEGHGNDRHRGVDLAHAPGQRFQCHIDDEAEPDTGGDGIGERHEEGDGQRRDVVRGVLPLDGAETRCHQASDEKESRRRGINRHGVSERREEQRTHE